MKRYASLIFSLLALTALADDITFTHKSWKVTFVEATHAIRMQSMRDGAEAYSPVVTNSFPEATYDNSQGERRTLNTADMQEATYTTTALYDEQFGSGTRHSITFTFAGEEATLTEHFYAYDQNDYLIVSMELKAEREIRSNYLAPINSSTSYRLLTKSSENRMLKVPFHNDGFQRYQRYQLNRSMTSYEVTAIYSGEDRHGLVVGSIDHDHWKSGIDVTGENDSNLKALKVYSGVSNGETADQLPHGKLRGTSISSARFYVDFNEDFRDGLDRFAYANTRVVPKYDTWTGGTPFGWQSWGVLAEKSNWTDVSEIAQYYEDVLQPGGFHNSQGNIIFSLDASDGLDDNQRKKLSALGKDRQQFFGNYSCPFLLWWGEDAKDQYVGSWNGIDYKVRDICIRVNGEPVRYAGAWALDPTHPKVKQDIVNFVNYVAGLGFRYIKCDFMLGAIMQSDSYYKAGIYTAVEAYNEGMRYLADRARAKGIFIALSISPLFPYQYANSRRIACDTWGSIGHTEYAMNAISSSWWTSGLYQYNDPDHLVLVGKGDQMYSSEGENRARYTSGAVTGMMLVADNFSTSNVSGRGAPELSKKRAQTIMFNPDVNEMADLGVSFRPLYGCKESQGLADHAENFFVHRTDKYLYLAGFNYSTAVMKGSISLADLGINPEEFSEVKELWTSEIQPLPASELSYTIPMRDARIYRFTLNTTGVKSPTEEPAPTETVQYDLAGRKLQAVQAQPHQKITISRNRKSIR